LKWNYGVPLLQVGYALFVNGRPSYCVRSFYPIVKGSDDITFRHEDKVSSSQGGNTMLGNAEMEGWIRTDPSLFNKSPIDFVTLLVERAVRELHKTVECSAYQIDHEQ
jgi:hypothetical protein